MRYLFISLSLCTYLILGSCRSKVDKDLPQIDPVPCFNALMQANQPVEAHLSWSEGFTAQPLRVIENAVVHLYEDSIWKETLTYVANGIYRGQTLAQTYKHYRFEVLIDSSEIIEATTIVPTPIEVIKIERRANIGADSEGVLYHGLQVTFKVNTLETQYIEFSLKPIEEIFVFFTNLRDPLILREGLPIPLFSTEACRDSVYSILLPIVSSSVSSYDGKTLFMYPEFYLQARSLSRDYFKYMQSVYLYQQGEFPEYSNGSLAPSNIFGNVRNAYGFVGSFDAYVSPKLSLNNL